MVAIILRVSLEKALLLPFLKPSVLLKFLIIQTKSNFSSPVKHCDFPPPPPCSVFKPDNSNQFAFPKVILKSGFYCINMILQITTSDMELELVRKKSVHFALNKTTLISLLFCQFSIAVYQQLLEMR